MRKYLISLVVVLGLCFCHASFAQSGLLFNVSSTGTSFSSATLTVTTTIARAYPNAGIRITTPGYTIGGGCTPHANGYCLFPVSNTTPATIVINGASGTMSANLCLNGVGALSCQRYTIPITVSLGFAYITNTGNNTVSICPVEANGALGACSTSNGNGTFNLPLMIVLNPVLPLAYIANAANNTVSLCPINADGSFGTCTVTTGTGTFNTPSGLATDVSGNFLYVTNAGSNTISICALDSLGSPTPCILSSAGGTLATPVGINFNASGDPLTTYAYIANNSTSLVSICVVNNLDGTLSACVTSSGSGTFTQPQGVSFNQANTVGYIGNFANNTVSICPVNNDGTFGACVTSTGSGTFDFSANTAVGLFMQSLSNIGYIPNSGNNTVSICGLNGSGSFGTCTTSNGFNQPSGVAIGGLVPN